MSARQPSHVDALPQVDDLRPPAGRPHHVPGADEIEGSARRVAHPAGRGELHVRHRAFTDDVDELVEIHVAVRHGAGCYVGSVQQWAVAAMSMRTGRIVVLAGPGVIDDHALDGLRAFARAGDLGVANTWGAKGVFAWDSPHHLGTCGLQARDFELLGWGDADAIVATGVDNDESSRDQFSLAPVIELAPGALAAAAGQVVARGEPLHNELYPRLAAVAQPGYVDDKVPLHPARAVADLGAVLPEGGLVAADPGIAGLWVARTFPTPALDPGQSRRVVVPARREPGVAARRALAAAETGRPAFAVTTSPIDDATKRLLDGATDRGIALVVVAWGERGKVRAADEHRTLLADALAARRPVVVEVPVSLDDTAQLIEAAGDVVAWGGLG